MRVRHMLVLAAIAATVLGTVPSSATQHCTTATGSEATPQFVDRTGDALTADTDPALNDQDITDLTKVWFDKSDDGLTTRVNIQTTLLDSKSTNQVFYALWDYEGGNAAQKRRFVSVITGELVPGVYGPLARFGYLDTVATPNAFVSQGVTTGRVVSGRPGFAQIEIPFGAVAADGTVLFPEPPSGAVLENLAVESRLLVGHPGHRHPEITGTGAGGGGLVFVADDVTNATEACVTVTKV